MQFSPYDEILEDDQQDAREREREAILRSIALLNEAREKGGQSREAIEALFYVDRLWTLLIDDLAHSENRLPDQLRASLISIGLWVLREIEDIRQNRSQNWQGLIEISEIICKGLG